MNVVVTHDAASTTASTAERILAAARTLLDKEGAEAVTMRRVAQAVGIRAALIDPYDFYPWARAPRFTDVTAVTDALLASLGDASSATKTS